jgi:hypothetical protein
VIISKSIFILRADHVELLTLNVMVHREINMLKRSLSVRTSYQNYFRIHFLVLNVHNVHTIILITQLHIFILRSANCVALYYAVPTTPGPSSQLRTTYSETEEYNLFLIWNLSSEIHTL